MYFSYSQIQVVIPPSHHTSGLSVTAVCEAIFRLKGTSYPTPVNVPETEGVRVLFMATDQEEVLLLLRSIGQKPVVLSTRKLPTTDLQSECPNCGWIISNPDCMRCSQRKT